MASLLNATLNATFISALYAIIAIGFTLIFGVGGVLNFAHGALLTVGAFGAYIVANPTQYGMNPWLGLLAAPILTALVGGVLYKGVIRYVEDQSVTLLILTFVIGFFVQHALRIFVTNQPISVTQPIGGQTTLLGQQIQTWDIVIFVVSWSILAAVFFLVN